MKRRLKHEKPVVEAFIKWADSQVVTGNGKFAKAITYIRNRRDYMMTYLEDSRSSAHCPTTGPYANVRIMERKRRQTCYRWQKELVVQHIGRWS